MKRHIENVEFIDLEETPCNFRTCWGWKVNRSAKHRERIRNECRGVDQPNRREQIDFTTRRYSDKGIT